MAKRTKRQRPQPLATLTDDEVQALAWRSQTLNLQRERVAAETALLRMAEADYTQRSLDIAMKYAMPPDYSVDLRTGEAWPPVEPVATAPQNGHGDG